MVAVALQISWRVQQCSKYSGSRLDAIQFDLSPNLSPFRREALNLTPLPYKGRGWGLGLYCTQLITAIVYKN